MKSLVLRLSCIAVTPMLWSCQPTLNLMPAPTGDKLEYYEQTPEDEKRATIDIGYATNRLIAPPDSKRFYAKEFDQNLRFGSAFVQIGDGEASWDEISELAVAEDRGGEVALHLTGVYRHGILPASVSLDTLNSDAQRTIDSFNDYLERSLIKDITVYVHGANNNFYRSVAQGAQYRHFTARTAPVVVYAWPSTENFLTYRQDLENIEATAPVLARFLELLGRHSDAERVNILAYSSGAELAVQALTLLGSRADDGDREVYREQLRLGQVYLTAPDTEYETFLQRLRIFADLVENTTVTINDDDFVLAISKTFGGQKSRLGAPDYDETDFENLAWAQELSRDGQLDVIYIDTEVVPNISKGSHTYWYENNWVSTDALILLNSDLRPAERGLVSVVDDEYGSEAWYFPPDYPERVEEVIDREVQAVLSRDP